MGLLFFRIFSLIGLVGLLSFHLHAEEIEDLANLNPIKGRGFITTGDLEPGGQGDLQLELTLQERFYAYGDKFSLKISEPEGLEVGELFIEPLVEFKDVVSKKSKKGLHETGTIKSMFTIPRDISSRTTEIVAELTYIACTKKFCLLPKKISIGIPVTIGKPKAGATSVDRSSTSYIKEQIEQNLAYAILLIFIFGLATSVTPCVYPLIPITLAVLGANKDKGKLDSFLLSLCYVVGIAMTYSILGVIAAQTGQLFGSFISHPAVTIAVSLIFFAMALSLFGLFELQPPPVIRDRLRAMSAGNGFVGAFVTGLTAGIIASPCVGPVLVGVLAYIAQSQDSVLGFVLLFTFAMGFGMLFIVLGTFSQLAQKLPRSGAWMNKVKALLGVAFIGLSLFYAWPLIKKTFPETTLSLLATENVGEKVKWDNFSAEKVIEAKEKGLPTIIDFYADWCTSCVEMDNFTFTDGRVIEKSKEFQMLKVDATTPFEGLNELQSKYKVYGLPTMIFIDPQGQVVDDLTLTGFEEAEDFLKRMESAKNHKKN